MFAHSVRLVIHRSRSTMVYYVLEFAATVVNALVENGLVFGVREESASGTLEVTSRRALSDRFGDGRIGWLNGFARGFGLRRSFCLFRLRVVWLSHRTRR